MTRDEGPREIMAARFTCRGPVEAPHDPTELDLPEDVVVRCPRCGKEYCRAPAWSAVWRAEWPKRKR